MKKTVSILLIVSLLGSIVLVLSSCKKCKEHVDENYDTVCDVCEEHVDPRSMRPADLWIKSTYKEKEYFSKAEAVAALNNMTAATSRGPLVRFDVNGSVSAGEVDWCLYNVEENKTLYSHKKEALDAKTTFYNLEFSYDGNYESEYFYYITIKTVADDGKVTYEKTAYTSVGNKIGSVSGETASSVSYDTVQHRVGDYFEFDKQLYAIKDGMSEHKLDATFIAVPNCDYSTDKYHYEIEGDRAYIYDNDLKMVRFYQLHAGADDASIYVLANGNLLVQYVVALADDVIEYDLYNNGEKFDLTSLIYNVDDDSVTAIELGFKVDYLVNAVTYPDFTDQLNAKNVSNMAAVSYIENKSFKIDEYVSLSNDGVILAYLDKTITAQYSTPTMIANDRFLLRDRNGNWYLTDGDGNIKGAVGSLSSSEVYRDGFIVADGKYYDLDLKLVLDPEESGYNNYSRNLYTKVVDETTKYYVLVGGALKEVTESGGISNIYTSENYFTYTTKDDTDRYKVYRNYDGSEILRIKTSDATYRSDSINFYGDTAVIRVMTYEDGKTLYTNYIAKR